MTNSVNHENGVERATLPELFWLGVETEQREVIDCGQQVRLANVSASMSNEPSNPPSSSTEGRAVDAVLFDFGGVLTTSPFEAFARYETEAGLPPDLIRTINSTNPDDNAWARFERSEVSTSGFVEAFEAEAAALGHQVDGAHVVSLLSGSLRPEMVEAVRRVGAAGFTTACLTNNFRDPASPGTEQSGNKPAEVMVLFDYVIESSKIGIRKPEKGFYERALEIVGVDANRSVFLDDLGINLKTARSMGMTTIKVVDPDEALAELEAVLGVDLRSTTNRT